MKRFKEKLRKTLKYANEILKELGKAGGYALSH